MKVLVLGGGGREHALAWKLAQSPLVQTVYVAPGNGGTAMDKRLENIPITDVVALREWAKNAQIDITVVGPEVLLAAGVVDEFRAHGLRIFGPTQAAAQLESSKAFSKDFMRRHGIPTARHETFTDATLAHRYVESQGVPIVVKADGLAAGKGVVVASNLAQAHEAVDYMLSGNPFGGAQDGQARVVIEEFLQGEEASFIVLCDGRHVLALASSQDHKRLQVGDQGPNTGGMGAYSPAPVVTPKVHARAMQEVIWPTVRGMEKDGIPFTGFLYAGLMVSPDGAVKTLEFNCRMGDPETQPIMARLKTDLVDVLWAATDNGQGLGDMQLEWDRRIALGVVLAAFGYPDKPRAGDAITGVPSEAADLVVFHAGTRLQDGSLQTSGGRVLCVTALADSVRSAQSRAHDAIGTIHFEGMQWRSDIGFRAIKR